MGIFHPNVDKQGSICLDILKEQWSPALSLQKVLLSVSSLLTDPNFSDPLNGTAANLHSKDPKGYAKTCKEMVQKYALPKADKTNEATGQKRKAEEPKAKAKGKAKAK